MFPATIFDYNGVLVDDEVVHLEAFRDVLSPLGLSLSEADYWDRYLGFDDAGAFGAILTDNGRTASAAEIDALVEAKRPMYLARARDGLRGFAGAAALVRRRAETGPVIIVSGALRSEIELGLSVLGVTEHVAAIVAAEDTARSKPDPEGYLLGAKILAERWGQPVAEGAVVIEDSISGIEAAKAARLVCIAVGHSYPLDLLTRAGADLALPTIEAITDDALALLHRRSKA